MANRTVKQPWPEIGTGQTGLTNLAHQHFAYLKTHLTSGSLRSRYMTLRLFLRWCVLHEVAQVEQLKCSVLQRYRRYVLARRGRDGQRLSQTHQFHQVHAVRAFCRWLTRHGYLNYNPVAILERVHMGRPAPQPVLTAKEAELLLSQPDINKGEGLRDRAILEVLYSTGLRRSEASEIEINDIDINNKTLFVRAGKGNKERLVPLGQRAIEWILSYLTEVRTPWAASNPQERHLFLNAHGKALNSNSITSLTRKYIFAAGITKKGASHLLRRTMATQMLNNGAEVKVIQQILGHSNIDTTTLYTRVSFAELKKVYERTHPQNKSQE